MNVSSGALETRVTTVLSSAARLSDRATRYPVHTGACENTQTLPLWRLPRLGSYQFELFKPSVLGQAGRILSYNHVLLGKTGSEPLGSAGTAA